MSKENAAILQFRQLTDKPLRLHDCNLPDTLATTNSIKQEETDETERWEFREKSQHNSNATSWNSQATCEGNRRI